MRSVRRFRRWVASWLWAIPGVILINSTGQRRMKPKYMSKWYVRRASWIHAGGWCLAFPSVRFVWSRHYDDEEGNEYRRRLAVQLGHFVCYVGWTK